MEREKNHRGRGMPRPYTYVSGDITENIRIKFYGIFEMKKQHDTI